MERVRTSQQVDYDVHGVNSQEAHSLKWVSRVKGILKNEICKFTIRINDKKQFRMNWRHVLGNAVMLGKGRNSAEITE